MNDPQDDPQDDPQNGAQDDPQNLNRPQNPNSSQNVHNGPEFNGPVSGAQFAWNNDTVTQNQQNNSAVAPGFEALAKLVTDLLRELPQVGLADPDREDAESAAREVLTTIARPGVPQDGRLRRALVMLRGALAPVATGVAAGTAAGAQEWAQKAIEGLTGIL